MTIKIDDYLIYVTLRGYIFLLTLFTRLGEDNKICQHRIMHGSGLTSHETELFEEFLGSQKSFKTYNLTIIWLDKKTKF